MTSSTPDRAAVSEAVTAFGWRYVIGTFLTVVPVGSFEDACRVAALAGQACGEDAGGHLRADLRGDRVDLAVHARAVLEVTGHDVDLVRAITTALAGAGFTATPGGAPADRPLRPVQALELAIDALDIPAVRPFWKAVLGYADEPGDSTDLALVDPAGGLPGVWFQQMDAPRPQRNRVHLDVWVAHDEAAARIEAALAAGGVMVSRAHAPSFWVLADVEGNEACVCTWQPVAGPQA